MTASTILLGALSTASFGLDLDRLSSIEPIRLGGNRIWSMAVDPNGTILATVEAGNGVVSFWDLQTLQALEPIKTDPADDLVFSPDWKTLVLDHGRTLSVWDVATRQKLGEIDAIRNVQYMAISPDGKTLASSGALDNKVLIWDVETLQRLATIEGVDRGRSLVFSPDSSLLIIGGRTSDPAIRLWDVASQAQVGELIGPIRSTTDLAFSPDGKWLAATASSATESFSVYLWDFSTREPAGVLGQSATHLTPLAFSPDGKLLATPAYFSDKIVLWDMENLEELGRLTVSDHTWNYHVLFTPDGKWLVGGDWGLELWQVNLPPSEPQTSAFRPQPRDGAIHPDAWAALRWLPGIYADSHDVYLADNFDDVNEGTLDAYRSNQTEAMLIVGFPEYAYPEGLAPATTYYWRIDEVNDTDPNSPWVGPVWSFTVPPMTAYAPDPADGAESLDSNVVLSWAAGLGARFHTVYFGDDYDDVANAAEGLSQAETTYSPGALEPVKTYYWRVDEFDGTETHKGDVWSFTTPASVDN